MSVYMVQTAHYSSLCHFLSVLSQLVAAVLIMLSLWVIVMLSCACLAQTRISFQ